ncbi:uncharacterized protein MYCFIDRAFT_177814 [Pseudocercospora fijiensis CIRAD86]|uniref:Uncharacterized protein n=1 Tax=Pseudocercospora fijiensis (strain CIRAD86) TaxID=383855 RepID=M2YN78_PSEFD|nr:uncharacterized protein MYCFIDRAFT_177814 [Pseudocercospora fijiensis CIRAD86]EME79170.1 hypothetical protein MYCFIDRAFT_177814 [Pseudocercospora fijiensis CIRAD86]
MVSPWYTPEFCDVSLSRVVKAPRFRGREVFDDKVGLRFCFKLRPLRMDPLLCGVGLRGAGSVCSDLVGPSAKLHMRSELTCAPSSRVLVTRAHFKKHKQFPQSFLHVRSAFTSESHGMRYPASHSANLSCTSHAIEQTHSDTQVANLLSAELRNEIYELALKQKEDQAVGITIDSSTNRLTTRAKNATALTRTCKQINQESSAMFYAVNNFVISKGPGPETKGKKKNQTHEVQILERFLKSIGPKNCAVLLHLDVQVHRPFADSYQQAPELNKLLKIANKFKPKHLDCTFSLESKVDPRVSPEIVSVKLDVLKGCQSTQEALNLLIWASRMSSISLETQGYGSYDDDCRDYMDGIDRFGVVWWWMYSEGLSGKGACCATLAGDEMSARQWGAVLHSSAVSWSSRFSKTVSEPNILNSCKESALPT